MPSLGFRYDDGHMWSQAVGKAGTTSAQWKRMVPKLRAAKRSIQTMARRGDQGFLMLPYDRTTADACLKLAKKMSQSFSDLVVLGVGGSDLGARALQEALGAKAKKPLMRVHFAGASTDPDALSHLLGTLDLKKTCINVISKSGETLETMAAFLVFRDLLIKRVGQKQMVKHIVATTDPETGSLRALAKKEGYATLSVPANVGGRFSVLSAVGLFPAAAMGIDIHELLAGARGFAEAFHEATPSECAVCRYAGHHVGGMQQRGQRVHVTMSYVAGMMEFGRWVRQLTAESLGKKTNRHGKLVYEGATPVAAIGPEDQHSQLQLWSEGPFDKLITFIEAREFQTNLSTPKAGDLGGHLSAVGGQSFKNLIHLQRQACAEALCADRRPNGTISIRRLDERSIGELILFFELSIAMMGELLDLNTYTQQGVQNAKRLVMGRL